MRRRPACLLSAPILVLFGWIVTLPSAAQTHPMDAPREPSSTTAGGLASIAKHNQLESVLGREVRTRVEEDVGRIIDLLVDRDGRMQAAVIEFGGFLGIGTRKIAVDWSALRFEGEGKKQRVIVELSRDQLRVAPEYKPSGPTVVQGATD